MKFNISSAENLNLTDNEITEILKESYLDEGFIEPEQFKSSFSPLNIRKRGTIYCGREIQSKEIAGMVISVDYKSPSKLFAKANEIEMHLLGVKPKYRNKGLGKLLIEKLFESLTNSNYAKILLWTQVNMLTAHKLYEGYGFNHNPSRDFERGNRNFLFYEKSLQPKSQ